MKSLIAVILIGFLFSCGDDGPNCPGDINLPVEITPFKLFYKIGDTIKISSKFYKLVYDYKTDEFYDATNYKFTPIIYMNTLDSAEEYNWKSKINEICTFVNNSHYNMNIEFSNDQGAVVGEYILFKDSLEFEVELILKTNGYFSFRVGSLSSGDGHLQNNYIFNCRGRKIIFNLVYPVGNNFQLLQKFRTKERNEWILSDSINRFYNHAGYCFEVR